MDKIVSYIPLVVSIFAVIASFYAVIENKIKRKQDLKLQIIKEKLLYLENASEIINDIPIDAPVDVRQFNKIVALKRIFTKNFLLEDNQKYLSMKEQFQKIYDNYEKVSGSRLNMYSRDLCSTMKLYGELDYPQELDTFYYEVKEFIETELAICQQELVKKSR